MFSLIFKFEQMLPKFKTVCKDSFKGYQTVRDCHSAKYVQGQTFNSTREHFYLMDNKGRCFLDDVIEKTPDKALKNKMLLKFLVIGIQPNKTGRYPEFDYISLRGTVRSYIRCQHLPIIFTQLAEDRREKSKLVFTICNSPISVQFHPEKLFFDLDTCQVFHPATRTEDEVGMVSESISSVWKDENRFSFEDRDSNLATHFLWDKKKIKLTNELISALDTVRFRRERLKRMK